VSPFSSVIPIRRVHVDKRNQRSAVLRNLREQAFGGECVPQIPQRDSVIVLGEKAQREHERLEGLLVGTDEDLLPSIALFPLEQRSAAFRLVELRAAQQPVRVLVEQPQERDGFRGHLGGAIGRSASRHAVREHRLFPLGELTDALRRLQQVEIRLHVSCRRSAPTCRRTPSGMPRCRCS
jgi:hypothetical protein